MWRGRLPVRRLDIRLCLADVGVSAAIDVLRELFKRRVIALGRCLPGLVAVVVPVSVLDMFLPQTESVKEATRFDGR